MPWTCTRFRAHQSVYHKKNTRNELIDGKWIAVEKEIPDKVTKWDTVHTPIGEQMHRLKYWKEIGRSEVIAISAVEFLRSKMAVWKIDLIIPIPPSDTTREFQPVYEIAERVGRHCSLPVDFEILEKLRPTSQLKEIDNPVKRREILAGVFAIQNNSLAGRNVLVFDDLYRSGETLNAACDVMIKKGNAKRVFVLTITKTRSRR
ncbi:MAG TPA: hypothetical protein VKR41_00155 [Puia sp.]|nr:hypothetical protein [Puia sp.]